jgi:hypothetical protein
MRFIRSAATFSAVAAVFAIGAVGASAATRINANPNPTPVVSSIAVARISAFPTGGPGSGSEATCGAYTQLLQRQQTAVDNTTGLANQAAQALLDNDVDNAMNAGCAVIY